MTNPAQGWTALQPAQIATLIKNNLKEIPKLYNDIKSCQLLQLLTNHLNSVML